MSSIPTPSPANRQTTQATSTTRQLPRQFSDYVTQFYGANASCIIRTQAGRYEFGLANITSLSTMQQEMRQWTNGIATNPGLIGTGSGGGGTGTTTQRKPMSLAARQKLSEAARRRAAERQATVGAEGHTEPVTRGVKRAKTMAAGN